MCILTLQDSLQLLTLITSLLCLYQIRNIQESAPCRERRKLRNILNRMLYDLRKWLH
jgi:hypothetical protein